MVLAEALVVVEDVRKPEAAVEVPSPDPAAVVPDRSVVGPSRGAGGPPRAARPVAAAPSIPTDEVSQPASQCV